MMSAARPILLLMLLTLTALTGCDPAPRGPAVMGPDVEAVRARHTAYGEALKRRDAAAASDICNACLITEAQEDGYGTFIKSDLGNGSLIADPNGAIVLGYVNVESSGDLAVSYGECTVTRTSPTTHQPVLRRGYCLTSWHRRDDGVWRIRFESRNVHDSLKPTP
jgi:hypothetical protein